MELAKAEPRNKMIASSVPVVSVVIPTYKHRDYVLDTLASVFAQTFADYEVIVVNDGSPDDTAEVLRPLRDAGRIHYVAQANGGQAAARNCGLARAQGEFVAYLDDDDLWPTDKLEWQVNYLRSCDAVLVGGAVALFRAGEPPHRHFASRADSLGINELAGGCPFVSPGQTLIRHSALHLIGGFDATVWGADDYDLYLRLAQCGELRSERRLSLRYRVHPANASRDRKRMLLNTHKVVRRHFSSIGGALSRKAHRSLYASAGREWVLAARRHFRHLEIRSALADLRNIACLVGAALRDIVLTKRIIMDLLPAWFSSEEAIKAHHLMVEIPAPASTGSSVPDPAL